MTSVSPLVSIGIQALLVKQSALSPKSPVELATSLNELKDRVQAKNQEHQRELNDLDTLVRPAADAAVYLISKTFAHSLIKRSPLVAPFDYLLGKKGLSLSDMIAGGVTALGDKAISTAMELQREKAEKEMEEVLREGLANLTERHRGELEAAIQEQHEAKQIVSLMSIPEISQFLDQFKDNPRQSAVVANFLLKDFKTKKASIASGGRYDPLQSRPSTENIEICAKTIDQSVSDTEKTIAEQKKQAEVMREGLASIHKNIQSLKRDMALDRATGRASLDKISMLEDLAKMRMTPEEKLALVKSKKLVIDPIERKKLEKFCKMQQDLQSAQKTMHHVNSAVNALSTWGVQIPPAIQTAVGVGNAAVSVFASIAAGDAVGTAIGAIGGLGLLFGKRRLDPAAQRQQQVMDAFDDILKGQEGLRKGQEQIFQQGQVALLTLSMMEMQQDKMIQGIADSMELQIKLSAEQLEAIDGVRREVIQGNIELMKAAERIIQGQISIHQTSLEIRKEVEIVKTSLADACLELSRQLEIIHEDVLYTIRLQIEDLSREISAWRDLGSNLVLSNMWNSVANRFVDYTALVNWAETNHATLNIAYGMYNTLIPQAFPVKGETLHPLLLWRTHVEEKRVHEGSRINGFRLRVYQPLIEWFGQLQIPQKWTYLFYPVTHFSDFKGREELASRFSVPHDLLHRSRLMDELVYPPYVCSLINFFPLLIQLRTIMRGEKVIPQENLLDSNYRLSDEPTLLLHRFYRLFDLAIAQQALIAGDVAIPYYWNQLFDNPIERVLSEQDQRFLMQIMYAKESLLTDPMRDQLRRYEDHPEEALNEEKEHLFDHFHLPYSNGVFVENLLRYVIRRYIERSCLDYENAIVSFNPFLLQQILPGWTCVYSQKRNAWLAIIKMSGEKFYLSFVLPSPYSIQKSEITYPEEMYQLMSAQQILGMAIREVELGHDQEFRSALMDLV